MFSKETSSQKFLNGSYSNSEFKLSWWCTKFFLKKTWHREIGRLTQGGCWLLRLWHQTDLLRDGTGHIWRKFSWMSQDSSYCTARVQHLSKSPDSFKQVIFTGNSGGGKKNPTLMRFAPRTASNKPNRLMDILAFIYEQTNKLASRAI